jgi:hypothetical protein
MLKVGPFGARAPRCRFEKIVIGSTMELSFGKRGV